MATPGEPSEDNASASRSQVHLDDKARRRALATVAFTLFLDLAGFGIILPILPYYAESLDASETAVALLATAFSAAQFVMSPVLGRISDRHGRRPVMLLSIAGSVAAALVLGFANALWVVFLARIVAGSSKANVSTAHAYVADLIAPDQRAKYMGLMGAAMGMGFVFGPAIGGLLAFDNMPALPFFVSAGLSAINFTMAAIWLPETHFPKRGAAAVASQADAAASSVLWRSGGLSGTLARIRGTPMAWLVVIAFGFYIAFAGMESTMALFSERMFEWGGRETGIFMTFIGVNMVFFQGVVVGRGLGAIGGVDHLTIALGLESHDAEGGASVASLCFYGFGGMMMAGGNGLTNATLSALVSRVSSKQEQGLNMGIKESSSALARVTGPMLAGPLFQHVDPGAPLMLGSVVALINVKLALLLGRRMQHEPGASEPARE